MLNKHTAKGIVIILVATAFFLLGWFGSSRHMDFKTYESGFKACLNRGDVS